MNDPNGPGAAITVHKEQEPGIPEPRQRVNTMTIKPIEASDEDEGTTTVDYSRDGVHAILTRYDDEDFWRLEVELVDYSLSTRDDHVAAARVIIAAARDLINRND